MRELGILAGLACALGAQAAPMTLDDAVRLALSSNRTLVSAALARESEQSSLDAAQAEFELKVLPSSTFGRIGSNALDQGSGGTNSSLGVRMVRKFETGTVVSVGPSYNRSGQDSNSTVNLSILQPLFKGWDSQTTLDGLRRAEFSVGSSQRSLDQTRINTALEAIGLYYDVLKQERLLALNRAQRERLERHLALTTGKERTGLADAMDLFRAEIRVKDSEDAVQQTHNALEAARDRLRITLNLPMDTPLELVAPALPAPPGRDPEEEAVRTRTEIVQLRGELEEARRSAIVAEKALLPDVNLQVNYGQAWTSDPFLIQYLPTTQRQWSVNLQASTDWARTAEKANLRRALTRVDSARVALEGRIEEVRRQVRQQRLAVDEAGSRIAIRRAQIGQAEGRLALAEVKFLHDLASNVDVMEAEADLQRTQASQLNAEAELAIGLYNLKAMAGILLESFASRPGAT